MSQSKDEENVSSGQFNTVHPEVLVSTMNDLPGYEVLEIYGTVFGITVRSRNLLQNIGAGFKSRVGGELKALSKNIEEARVSAVDRLVGHAMGLHANAVIAMRFDTSTSGDSGYSIAVTAYGTACKVRKKEVATA